ncbi:MAG: yfkN 1 [Herbinix sp.]|nr:yfkN 1 [Herbinix sp.]
MLRVEKKFGHRLRHQFIICLAVVLTLLSFTTNVPVEAAAKKEQGITILFTHDLHDNLLPFQAVESGKVAEYGGYARLKSAIDKEKEIDPEAITADGGDFSMGTPFQTIFETEAPSLVLLGAMGYDVTTLGNHEFDYRPRGLTACLTTAVESGKKLPVIVQSNVAFPVDEAGAMSDTLTNLKTAMEEYGVSDYTVLERNGYKIGIFGVMGEESESMAPMSEVTFSDEIEQAKRVVEILKEKEKVDFILCLSHSGTKAKEKESEDELLAKGVPDIDFIISGHTHTTLSEPKIVGNTVIGSVGCYGEQLGIAKLSPDAFGNWKLNSYKLKLIDDSFSEDGSIKELVTGYKKIVQKDYFDSFAMEYDEVVATSTMQFQTPEELAMIHGEATIGNLISDAYIYSVKKAEGEEYTTVDAAIVPSGTIRDSIYPGEVTTADAFSISSLGIGADGKPGYPLISVYLTGKELKTACEVDASITPLMADAQLYMSGVNFTFNSKRLIFNKVVKTELMKEDGSVTEIEDTRLYRVVCNLYSAQMLSIVGDKSYGLMSIVPKDKEGNPITDFEKHIIHEMTSKGTRELKEWYAVVQYLKSFDNVDGISQIPAYYGATHERKVIDNDKSIIAVLSNPNQIGIAVYCIVSVLFLLILFVIHRITTRKRRRRKRRSSNSKTTTNRQRKTGRQHHQS